MSFFRFEPLQLFFQSLCEPHKVDDLAFFARAHIGGHVPKGLLHILGESLHGLLKPSKDELGRDILLAAVFDDPPEVDALHFNERPEGIFEVIHVLIIRQRRWRKPPPLYLPL